MDQSLPSGYRFAGLHCGIRADAQRGDLAFAFAERPAVVAGAYTQNRVRAAPVRLCEARTPTSAGRGLIVCAGNANACTGQQGERDAQRMAECTAARAGVPADSILVCSTGVIGRRLPMERIEAGIERIVPEATASWSGVEAFARAILTTDTVSKIVVRQFDGIRFLGIAKGAAMIGPNLATMLAFVFCDAAVADDDLSRLIKRTALRTFNCVRVEGHTSTNDTLLAFANGQGQPLSGDALSRFAAGLEVVCSELAQKIAADAEGASHQVTIDVEGCRDDADAFQIACAVADSPLCKTAIFGADPNWGRFVSAAGYAGVPFEEKDLSLWLGDLCLYERGAPLPFDAATASAYLRNNREVHLRLRFTLGAGRATVWTCDLTYEYIKLNADYTT
ncbi:MAG: bifunctional glutamate N-acetyltransferase/amino-acid acetyltransferase ArgJ [Gemmataceae bacterium]